MDASQKIAAGVRAAQKAPMLREDRGQSQASLVDQLFAAMPLLDAHGLYYASDFLRRALGDQPMGMR